MNDMHTSLLDTLYALITGYGITRTRVLKKQVISSGSRNMAKNAISCIATLAPHLSHTSFDLFVQHLLKHVNILIEQRKEEVVFIAISALR